MTKTLSSIIITWLIVVATTGVCFSQNAQPQSPDLLESRNLNSSVMKLYSEGKYDEALPLAKRAVELREKALGASHQDLIPLLLNLGELYRVKQKLGEARSTYERALQLSEKAFGLEDLKVAKVLDKLAYLTHDYQSDPKAEEFLARSLRSRKRHLGPKALISSSRRLIWPKLIVCAGTTRGPSPFINELFESERRSAAKRILD